MIHFIRVQNIITGNRINSDRGFNISIHTNISICFRRDAITCPICGRDAGINVVISFQIIGQHIDAIGQITWSTNHISGIGITVNRQSNRITSHDIATDTTCNGGIGLTCFIRIEDIITRNWVNSDRRFNIGIHTDITVRFCRSTVTCRIGSCNAGINVVISFQIIRQYIDAIGQVTATAINHITGIGVTVDRQSYGIASHDITTDTTSNRGIGLIHFVRVQDIIASNRINGDRGFNVSIHTDITIRFCRSAITCCICGCYTSINVVVSFQIISQYIDAVSEVAATAINHITGISVAIDGQGDGITGNHITTHTTGNRGIGLIHFIQVQNIITGDWVNGDRGFNVSIHTDITIRFCRSAITCRICGCYAGINVVISFQVIGQHIDAVSEVTAAINHITDIGVAIDGQRYGITGNHITTDTTGNRGIGLIHFIRVKDIITGNRINGDRGFNIGIHTDITICFCRSTVTCRIRSRNAGINTIIGFQIIGQHIDTIGQITATAINHITGIGVTVDRQSDGITGNDITTNTASNRGIGLIHFIRVQDVIAGNWINGDRGFNIGIHTDITICFCRSTVTCRIRSRNAGINTIIGFQIIGQHIDTIGQITATAINHITGIGVTVDRQSDGITRLDIVTHTTGNGGIGLIYFVGVKNIITSDRINGDRGFNLSINRDRTISFCCCAVTRIVRRGYTGINTIICFQIIGQHIDTIGQITATAIHHITGIGITIHRQSNCITGNHIATDSTCDSRIGLIHFFGIQDIVYRDRIDGDLGFNIGIYRDRTVCFSLRTITRIICRGYTGIDRVIRF